MNFDNIKSMYFEGKRVLSAWLNGKRVWLSSTNK